MYLITLFSNETLEPFCNIPKRNTPGRTQTDCTYDHLSVGTCNLIKYASSIPNEYQVLITNVTCTFVC